MSKQFTLYHCHLRLCNFPYLRTPVISRSCKHVFQASARTPRDLVHVEHAVCLCELRDAAMRYLAFCPIHRFRRGLRRRQNRTCKLHIRQEKSTPLTLSSQMSIVPSPPVLASHPRFSSSPSSPAFPFPFPLPFPLPQLIEYTALSCSSITLTHSHLYSATRSHIRIVLSSEPDARKRPLGENASVHTVDACPVSVVKQYQSSDGSST